MEPGPWQGGKPGGYLQRVKDFGWSVRFAKQKKIFCEMYFSGKVHGSLDTAKQCAEKWRIEKSAELCITKNQFRFLDPNTVEVKLGGSNTFIADARDLEIVEKYVWHFHRKNRGVGGYAINCEVGFYHSLISGFTCTDHIDRNGLNNRRANLREATPKLNANNMSMSKNNISGITGVCRQTVKSGEIWVAHWSEDGKLKRKSFAINKYGDEQAKNLAVKERRLAAERAGNTNGVVTI